MGETFLSIFSMTDMSSASALGALDAESRKEFWASLALKHTKGLGGRTCKKLLSFFGSAFNAVQNVTMWRDAGVRGDTLRALTSDLWRTPAKKEWEAVRGCSGKILLWTDPYYPQLLKELPDPPVFLYCLGDLSLLSNPCVAIVGTRKCSINGIQTTRTLAKDLSTAGITVVSGMALGIDREAHLASIDYSGSTIAVLGSGIDINYPRQNSDVRKQLVNKGLLLSEYAPGVHPEPGFFPIRNRIISGLSLGVLVVEAALHSGSLITAHLALEQNRSVYAIPGALGSPFAEGCQDLIQQGAQPVSSIIDILEDLAEPLKRFVMKDNKEAVLHDLESSDTVIIRSTLEGKTSNVEPSSMPTDKKNMLNTFVDELHSHIVDSLVSGPKDVESLCQNLQASVDELSSALIILEVQGIVRRLPNTQYILVKE